MQNMFKESSKNQESIFALFLVISFWQQSASAIQSQRCKADKSLEASEKMLEKFSFTVRDYYQDRLLQNQELKQTVTVFLSHPYILAACFSELSGW